MVLVAPVAMTVCIVSLWLVSCAEVNIEQYILHT
jgi:hypothetical protein